MSVPSSAYLGFPIICFFCLWPWRWPMGCAGNTGIGVEVASNPNNEFLVNLTQALLRAFHFENFIFYSDKKQIHHHDQLLVRDLTQNFQRATIVFDKSRLVNLRYTVGLRSLIFWELVGPSDPLFSTLKDNFENVHALPMVLVYKTQSNLLSMNDIRTIFQWCWSHYMTNVLIVQEVSRIYSNMNSGNSVITKYHVFKYTPFPMLTVFNLTGQSFQDMTTFFTKRLHKVDGYKFVTPFYQLAPYVFMAPAAHSCHRHSNCPNIISGTGARIYHEFIKTINGTIELIPRNVTFFEAQREVMEYVMNRSIHIGILLVSDLFRVEPSPIGSYPVGMLNICVMVPVLHDYNHGSFILRAFSSKVWSLVVALMIALILLQYVNNVSVSQRRKSARPHNGNDVVLYAFGRLTNQPLLDIVLRQHGLLYRLLQMLILFMCFLIVHIYEGTLTSLLSTTQVNTQIESVEDLLRSEIKLIMDAEQKSTLFDTNRLPKELLAASKVLDWPTVYNLRKGMNYSFAYISSSDYWEFICKQQRSLHTPIFRLSSNQLCTRDFYLRFPIRRDSPFWSSFLHFSLAIQESGLYLKWKQMNQYQADRLHYFTKIEEHKDRWKPLCLNHFSSVIWICALLYVGAIVYFCCELLWHKWFSSRGA